jgi:anti-sigma regulatory factor (Ser/Thr protein kinase)
MIELLLGAVKLALSEDARKSASGLMDFIRKSPDWQKDICTLEAKVDCDSREHAYLLGGLTGDKMTSLGYARDAVDGFNYVYRELTSNAFEHGCKPASKDRVTIVIEITGHYVSLVVSNPRGTKFDLAALLEQQAAHLKKDHRSRRGRGLVICNDFADSLTAVASGEGIKALFFKPSVVLKLSQLEEVAVIHVLSGLENPSVRRRIKALAEQNLDRDLILDIELFGEAPAERRSHPSTTIVTGSLELLETFEKAGRKLVVLIGPNSSPSVFRLGIFDPSVVAFSPAGAAEKLGKPGLKSKIEKLLRKPKSPGAH